MRSGFRDYPTIGAKGIRVRWTEFRPFHAWALKSGYAPGLVLVRIDRAKDYTPSNCRWMTAIESNAFKRPLTIPRTPRRTLTALGETKGLVAWTKDPRCSVTLSGLMARLESGMTPEQAITKPKQPMRMPEGTRLITAFGMTQSISSWERDRRAKVGAPSISDRLKAGWTAEDAISVRAMGAPRSIAGPRTA